MSLASRMRCEEVECVSVALVGTKSRPPKWIKPQLTRLVEEAPTGKDWVDEIKYDGYRMNARIDGGQIKLLTRTGLDWSHRYRSTIEALHSLPVKAAYLDGEICALNADGVPVFSRLQAAMDEGRTDQLVFFALLFLNGQSTAQLPLMERRDGSSGCSRSRSRGAARGQRRVSRTISRSTRRSTICGRLRSSHSLSIGCSISLTMSSTVLPLTTGPGSWAAGGGTLSWTTWLSRAKADVALSVVPPPTRDESAGRAAGSKGGFGISVLGKGGIPLGKWGKSSITTELETLGLSLKKTSAIFFISTLQPAQARRRRIPDRVVARHKEPATTQKGYGKVGIIHGGGRL
jgi:hypothetical protein